MFQDPLHWFPTPFFSTLLAILFFGSFLADYFVLRIVAPASSTRRGPNQDRSSFGLIQVAGVVVFIVAIGCRYYNLLVVPPWVQWLGLVIGTAGISFRLWAMITLGRFFSRVVEIEDSHRLITDGPYRRIRHPAYTGMIVLYIGLALAVGSAVGALLTAVIITLAILYRIRIEEAALASAFGAQYSEYAGHTWMLFPGW